MALRMGTKATVRKTRDVKNIPRLVSIIKELPLPASTTTSA